MMILEPKPLNQEEIKQDNELKAKIRQLRHVDKSLDENKGTCTEPTSDSNVYSNSTEVESVHRAQEAAIRSPKILNSPNKSESQSKVIETARVRQLITQKVLL